MEWFILEYCFMFYIYKPIFCNLHNWLITRLLDTGQLHKLVVEMYSYVAKELQLATMPHAGEGHYASCKFAIVSSFFYESHNIGAHLSFFGMQPPSFPSHPPRFADPDPYPDTH
jgi:hypothetical protein